MPRGSPLHLVLNTRSTQAIDGPSSFGPCRWYAAVHLQMPPPIKHPCRIAENLCNAPVPYPLKFLYYAALSDLFRYLPKSKAQPGDLKARQKLLIAAWMSIWPLKVEEYG